MIDILKTKNVLFTSVFLILLLVSKELKSQTITQSILNKSIEACKALQSIEYEIYQKAAKSRYGWPEIRATIIQQKENVKNVSFGKAYMKARGTIKHRGKELAFDFSYDGNQFLLKKGEDTKIKKVKDPTIISVSQLLQQHLTMLYLRPYTNEPPYAIVDGGGSANYEMFDYDGDEYINGELCHKLKFKIGLRIKKSSNSSKENVKYSYWNWWISSNSYLPIAFTDNFAYKTIKIKNINFKHNKSFYSVNEVGSTTELYSHDRIRKELYSDYLLPVNSISPEWSFTSKNKVYSSKNFRGKIVLFDFWGTWCPPCLQSMPEIEKISQDFDKEIDVLVVGISAKERDKNAPIEYFKRQGYTYLHIPNGDVIANAFKVRVYPTLYIIDRNGVIRYSSGGFDKSQDSKRISQLIKSLL